MKRVIGIDLGTTNSCVAVLDGGTAQVIANRGGYKTTPSMVAITETGRKLVGHIAKRQAITNAENTVYAAKRLIGRKFNSPQVMSAVRQSSFRIVEGPHGEARIALRSEVLSVPEISALILQELKIVAEDFLGEPVEQAVITVPAYFNDNQRQATKDAGLIAGLDVIRIVNEPTAAAISYGTAQREGTTIAVYDFGGGTFDVSILELGKGGVFKVLGTAGDTFLGGEDVDERIVDWLVGEFLAEHKVDLRSDRMARQRLKDAAEKAKCELSTVTSADLNLPFIISNERGEALHLQRSLTRVKLEELTADLIDRSIDICLDALSDAGLEKGDVDDVILVGGMTRMPAIQRKITEVFGREPNRSVHPDECVAIGAAMHGSALAGVEKKPIVLLDVTPLALGIMTHGGGFDELVPANTTVPTTRVKSFTTSRDGQTRMSIVVQQVAKDREGEREMLGEFALEGLSPKPKSEVVVDVSFSIDANGIVAVEALEQGSGKKAAITVEASSGLTKPEIQEMQRSAAQAIEERRQGEAIESERQAAQSLVSEVERLLEKLRSSAGDSSVLGATMAGIEAVLGQAKVLLSEARDPAKLKALLPQLERAAQMLRSLGN
jgi:molecular chaperone DnaK